MPGKLYSLAMSQGSLHPSGPLGAALAGLGRWGWVHFQTLRSHPDFVLRAVCDASPEVRKRVQEEAPDLAVVDGLEDLLAMENLEAVTIATPSSTHGPFSRRALEAGKHVLVEKPLCHSPKEGASLCRSSEENRRILMVGHLLRYHPAFESLEKAIAEGVLGEILYFTSRRLNLGVVRLDENALWSFAPHDLSLALKVFGGLPKQVWAQGADYLGTGNEDLVFVHADFGDGRMAHLQVGWFSPEKRRECVFVGTKAMAIFDDLQPKEKIRILEKGGIPGKRGTAPELFDRGGRLLPFGSEQPLTQEYRHFAAAIRGEELPRTPCTEGLAVVKVLAAADHSLRNGGHPVSLED